MQHMLSKHTTPVKQIYGKYWLFTINNPTRPVDEFNKRLVDLKTVQAYIFQVEQGEKEKTYHWQGYIEFSDSLPFSRVKKILGDNSHIEKRKGTAQQAIDYCSKTETRISGPYQNGTFTITSQGKRTDLINLVETIHEASSLNEVVRQHPPA